MRQLWIVMIVLFSLSAQAQIKTNINLSPRHKQKLEKIKNPKKKARKHKKFYKKDSLRYLEKLDKILAKKYDSLFNKHEDKIPGQYKDHLNKAKKVKGITDDSLSPETLEDASDMGKEHLDKLDKYKQAEEVKSQVEEYTGDLKNLPDSSGAILKQLPETAEQQAARRVDGLNDIETRKAELEKLKNTPQNYQNKARNYQQKMAKMRSKEYMRKLAIQKAKMNSVKHFAKHTKKIEAAQQKLGKLKKKYSSVLNSNDLSTATKKNSLTGTPLKERFILGGNLEVNTGDPTSLDFSPTLAYRINKVWTAGLGGSYRANFGEEIEFWDAFDQDVYGYRVFSEYVVFKNFFTHGEFESMNVSIKNPAGEIMGRQWVSGALAGMGKNYNFINKVKGNVMVLYDFLHGDSSPHKRPWVIRFGFHIDSGELFE